MNTERHRSYPKEQSGRPFDDGDSVTLSIEACVRRRLLIARELMEKRGSGLEEVPVAEVLVRVAYLAGVRDAIQSEVEKTIALGASVGLDEDEARTVSG